MSFGIIADFGRDNPSEFVILLIASQCLLGVGGQKGGGFVLCPSYKLGVDPSAGRTLAESLLQVRAKSM